MPARSETEARVSRILAALPEHRHPVYDTLKYCLNSICQKKNSGKRTKQQSPKSILCLAELNREYLYLIAGELAEDETAAELPKRALPDRIDDSPETD